MSQSEWTGVVRIDPSTGPEAQALTPDGAGDEAADPVGERGPGRFARLGAALARLRPRRPKSEPDADEAPPEADASDPADPPRRRGLLAWFRRRDTGPDADAQPEEAEESLDPSLRDEPVVPPRGWRIPSRIALAGGLSLAALAGVGIARQFKPAAPALGERLASNDPEAVAESPAQAPDLGPEPEPDAEVDPPAPAAEPPAPEPPVAPEPAETPLASMSDLESAIPPLPAASTAVADLGDPMATPPLIASTEAAGEIVAPTDPPELPPDPPTPPASDPPLQLASEEAPPAFEPAGDEPAAPLGGDPWPTETDASSEPPALVADLDEPPLPAPAAELEAAPPAIEPSPLSEADTATAPLLTPNPGAGFRFPDEQERSRWIPIPRGNARPRVAEASQVQPMAGSGRLTPPDAPVAPGPLQRHVVRRGENFYTIARRYYGTGDVYRALWQANRDQVPIIDELYVGTEIVIPPKWRIVGTPAVADRPTTDPAVRRRSTDPDEGPDQPIVLRSSPTEARSGRAAPTHADDRVHMVGPNETLRSIARTRLGDPDRADELLELNKDRIDDPRRLRPDTLLVLPPES